jgi:hypothetical protein
VLEMGCGKNVNMNPVAQRAVIEFENELLRQLQSGSSIFEVGPST